MMNSGYILGRVAETPEAKTARTGTEYCLLAFEHDSNDGKTHEFRASFFGRLAERAAALHTGELVFIQYHLTSYRPEGKQYSYTQLTGHSIMPLDSLTGEPKEDEAEGEPGEPVADWPPEDDSIPF